MKLTIMLLLLFASSLITFEGVHSLEQLKPQNSSELDEFVPELNTYNFSNKTVSNLKSRFSTNSYLTETSLKQTIHLTQKFQPKLKRINSTKTIYKSKNVILKENLNYFIIGILSLVAIIFILKSKPLKSKP